MKLQNLLKFATVALLTFGIAYSLISIGYQKGLKESDARINELTNKVLKYQSEEEQGGAVLDKFVIAESDEGNIYVQLKENDSTIIATYNGGQNVPQTPSVDTEGNWILLQTK